MIRDRVATAEEEARFEQLIQGLLDKGFGVCDQFLEAEVIAGLRTQLLADHQAGSMHPAGVGRKFDFQRNTRIRGDVIRWLQPHTKEPSQRQFISTLNHFLQYLNASCYTGINDYEFHFAYYEPNSFYKRHLDQFKSDKGRVFSLVLYLNKDWNSDDGGRLTLYPASGPVDVLPLAGRGVFFRSAEMEHEVHPAYTRARISIAGWLKRV